MTERLDIVRECRSEIQAISRTLAEEALTTHPLPWMDDLRKSLTATVEDGIRVATTRDVPFFTERELRRFRRDAVRVFDERISELLARGTTTGRA